MHKLYLFFSLTTMAFALKPHEKKEMVASPATFAANERMISHKLGERTIYFKVSQYGESANICCVNLHDDEITAVKAARSVLEERGGLLIKIENDSKRNISFTFKGAIYTVDPNRIFSRVGILGSLRTRGKINPLAVIEVEKFAAHLLQLIPDSITCLIALHNNTNGDFSVRTYMPGGKRQGDACQVYADEWQDIDDIALTTDQTIYNKMAAVGYNSILQDNINVNKDGSLSVYYGELNRRYINIETEHGKTKQYRDMLVSFLNILDQEKKSLNSFTAATAD